MDRTSGRRGLLQLGTACALVLATPVFARDAKKKAEDAISPPEDLMREHAILDRILLIYESGMRRLGQGEDIDPAVFVQSATIMRDFIHGYHEKSEEELVFPRFKTAGRMAMSEGMPNCSPVLLEPIMLVRIHVPADSTASVNGVIVEVRPYIFICESPRLRLVDRPEAYRT